MTCGYCGFPLDADDVHRMVQANPSGALACSRCGGNLSDGKPFSEPRQRPGSILAGKDPGR